MLSDRHISLRIWMLSQSSTFSRRLDGPAKPEPKPNSHNPTPTPNPNPNPNLTEAIRIARMAYPDRMPHAAFSWRYAVLARP